MLILMHEASSRTALGCLTLDGGFAFKMYWRGNSVAYIKISEKQLGRIMYAARSSVNR